MLCSVVSVCVCLTVTHFFSGRGALTFTTAAFFAAHPFPKGVTARVPSFALTHGAVPTAPQSTVSGTRVLGGVKKVRTCRPTAGSAPSRLVASPKRHS